MGSKIFRDIHVYGEHFPGWEAVVGCIGETLVAKGCARREYSEYIKKDVVENETYMVIVPHFALLHSVPEHRALENILHFMKLERPAEFGHENNDPVTYMITFTSVDTGSHIAGISLLAGMLVREGLVEELSRAGSDKSLAACIRKYEEQEKNTLEVNAVCTNGMGSSLILKMAVEKALKELGIGAQVVHMDAGQFKSRHLPDVCITVPSLMRIIGEQEGMILIMTESFTDAKAAKEKIRRALNIEEQ